MKRLWAAVGLLGLLLGASLYNGWYAGELTGRIGAGLEQAEQQVDRGQWDRAEQLARQAYGEWQSSQGYFHTVMRHGDIDQVLRTFQEVMEHLEAREEERYRAASADLLLQLALLAEMERPSLTNIL